MNSTSLLKVLLLYEKTMREEKWINFHKKVPIMENIGGEMMEGSTFYFVAWIGWIVVTFFMKKGLYSVEDKRLYIDFYYFVLRYM